eukprot:XP_001703828.1 Hypothetical protein GL50803_123278 [Giardia lamblia ATCC 50803]
MSVDAVGQVPEDHPAHSPRDPSADSDFYIPGVDVCG